MVDTERWFVVGAGLVGLVAFVVGAILGGMPKIDAAAEDVVAGLAARRARMLAGAVLTVTGMSLLLWPLTAVAVVARGYWPTLGPFSVALWVFGFGMLALATVLPLGLVWRDPTAVPDATGRLLLDGAHLIGWAVSAPLGALATVATTALGLQAELFGPVVVVLAVAKIVTVVIEVAGTGRRTGWNAGGWAAGSSGYVTVIWLAAVLLAFATA